MITARNEVGRFVTIFYNFDVFHGSVAAVKVTNLNFNSLHAILERVCNSLNFRMLVRYHCACLPFFPA